MSRVRVVGPPTQELAERVRMVLERELTFRERNAKEKPEIWGPKVIEVNNALGALEELADRASDKRKRKVLLTR